MSSTSTSTSTSSSFPVGSDVELRDLVKGPQLNGLRGIVKSDVDESTGTQEVYFIIAGKERTVAVKLANLRKVDDDDDDDDGGNGVVAGVGGGGMSGSALRESTEQMSQMSPDGLRRRVAAMKAMGPTALRRTYPHMAMLSDAEINVAISQMEEFANDPAQLKMVADKVKNMSGSEIERRVKQAAAPTPTTALALAFAVVVAVAVAKSKLSG